MQVKKRIEVRIGKRSYKKGRGELCEMEERHVSNEQDTTISSKALLKSFYKCILDMATDLSMSEQSTPKSAVRVMRKFNSIRYEETIQILLLIDNLYDFVFSIMLLNIRCRLWFSINVSYSLRIPCFLKANT